MKRFTYILILLAISVSIQAYDFQVGDFYYNITSSSAPYTAEVTYQRYQSPTNYSGLTIATIPETVTYSGTTYSVKSIGYRAFYYSFSLTSITIPNSVTSIGDEAFYYCRSLTSITIPNSVTSIGDEAFYYCRSLTSVTIPESVKSIGDEAFYRCMFTIDNFVNHSSLDANANNYWGARVGNVEIDGLLIRNDTVIGCRPYVTTAVIPNSVTSIGDEAFSGCSSLTSVTIPNSVKSIGNYAFCDCSSLTSITIPNSVTSIGDEAFRGCSLTSITIPNSVTSIGNYTFYGCSSLTSPVYNAHCFAYLPTSFEGTYIVPDGIKQIAGGAFRDCRSLTSITIPNSVTSIGSWAFTYCSSLTSVTIPESVTSIGDEAFAYCSSLTSMSVEDGNTTYDSRDNCNAIIETATNTLIAGCQNTIIPNSVTSIGNSAFSGCSSLTSITIPNSVTSIGDEAFRGCSALDTVSINATTPPTLGEKALSSVSICYIPMCTQVDYVNSNWNDYVDTFEEYLLYAGSYGPNIKWKYKDSKLSLSGTGNISKLDCTPWELLIDSIKEIEIENGITKIPADAFSNYTKLNKITLPSSLEEIGANAFANCRRLYEIYSYASIPPLAEVSSFTNYNATLYVPCEHKQYYQSDMVFRLFSKIDCISSEEVETDGVIVVPGANDVTITWLKEEGADTYTIVIKKDGEVVCTLTFNSAGQLINVAFAPGRNGNHPAQYAEQVANGKGYRFTVTGLEEGTHYTYNIDVRDIADKTINSHSGEFITGAMTEIENITPNSANIHKILRDNQLIIVRDGVEYNAVGQEL